MVNICEQCKMYRVDKTADVANRTAVCPECGYGNRFVYQPLFFVCGASGAGKSALCNYLMIDYQEVIVLDGDILWQAEFNAPEDGYRTFFETWLRVAKNVSQAGRPVAIFIAGGVPQNVAPCIESRYFSEIHYLGVVCDDRELCKRLKARPSWRDTQDEAVIEGHISFNRWIKDSGREHGITLLDTTADSLAESAEKTIGWFRQALKNNSS